MLKPSELAPQTAIWLMQALQDAGLPDGVANLVLGRGADVGVPLTEDPRVDLVSFTGGLETGRAIMAAAAPTVKRVALELGGKNPNVIFADADLDAAIDNALTAVFLDSGQVCSAGARLIVEASVHDQVVDEIVRRAGEIRLGGPFDEQAETGPLIDERARFGSAPCAYATAGGARCRLRRREQLGTHVHTGKCPSARRPRQSSSRLQGPLMSPQFTPCHLRVSLAEVCRRGSGRSRLETRGGLVLRRKGGGG